MKVSRAMSMWERVERFGGPDIAQKHRRCDVCRRPFLSGAIRVERGHSIGAVCHTCIAAMTRDVCHRDLFTRAR
jgi:hypothetical protein